MQARDSKSQGKIEDYKTERMSAFQPFKYKEKKKKQEA